MIFYVDTSTMEKSFLSSSLNLGNPSLLSLSLPLLKGSMVYTIPYITNYLKYSWSQLISFSISYTLCVHLKTAAIFSDVANVPQVYHSSY